MNMADLGDVLDDDIDLAPVKTPEIVIEEVFNDKPLTLENIMENKSEGNDILNDLLRSKGIENGKIKVIGEDNQEEEVPFNSLSREEQLEILNYTENVETDDLDESEIEFLNSIRSQNKSISQFLEEYKQDILSSANITDSINYDIDAYDDQELYLLDLKNKYDLTEEELVKELEKELQDPDLFKRKTDKLREEYKQLEDNYNATQKQEFEDQRQQEYNTFVNQMQETAGKLKEFHGIEIEDTEQPEVLEHLLRLDQNGVSEFYKDLNNPDKLYELAWYSKYGKTAFEALHNAYEQEISRIKAEKVQDKKQPVFIKKPETNEIKSIFDLD